MREKIILICEDCLQRNYKTFKNKTKNIDRLNLNKFCKNCNAHKLHKESR
ncbi:50S ribosomal protein L33 [Spiroplasma endosymbiont of Amphibalanus improvisus]